MIKFPSCLRSVLSLLQMFTQILMKLFAVVLHAEMYNDAFTHTLYNFSIAFCRSVSLTSTVITEFTVFRIWPTLFVNLRTCDCRCHSSKHTHTECCLFLDQTVQSLSDHVLYRLPPMDCLQYSYVNCP